MSKIITLNCNGDFRRIYARGKSYANPALVTYVMRNRAGICRIGITTSKKIGNAVERNRSRRLIKAAYSQLFPEIKGGWDLVLVARGATKYKKSTDIQKVMRIHLEKAGVLGKAEEK